MNGTPGTCGYVKQRDHKAECESHPVSGSLVGIKEHVTVHQRLTMEAARFFTNNMGTVSNKISHKQQGLL